MARPRWHTLIAAPVALAAARRWGHAAGAAVMAGGVLIDADHLIDFVWVKLSRQRRHYLAPLHAWELAGAAFAVGQLASSRAQALCPLPDARVPQRGALDRLFGASGLRVAGAVLTGLGLGIVVHLIQDIISNRPAHPVTYSLTFRAWNRFEQHAVGWGAHPDFQGWSGTPWWEWF